MRLGFFFGAGAEVGYGLSSGGRFALDLFRYDVSEEKERLRNQLTNNIDRRTPYATNWLPDSFWTKRIHAFGKNEFVALIESSIEYRKNDIIEYLNDIDTAVDQALKNMEIKHQDITNAYYKAFNRSYGEHLYSQTIQINPKLSKSVNLFESDFYSALLDILESGLEGNNKIKRYASSFLQLLVGAYGQDLIQELNQEIFVQAPDNIPIFDDINGMFNIEFSRAGVTALEIILNENKSYNLEENDNLIELFCAVSHKILEDLFSKVLDYQSLVDSHFRYLFSPRTEWAKFTKMVIFLRLTRTYIASQLENIQNLPKEGYYHDVLEATQKGLEIGAVGTANYNSLFESIVQDISIGGGKVFHLNGSVKDFYNPYKNVVISQEPDKVPQDQIYVPFILTQSGLKPLTSVGMSRRYVELFDQFRECDAIVCVGYRFNVDDSHINGLFRELVESHSKYLFWVIPKESEDNDRKVLAKRLRISPEYREQLEIVPIDKKTRFCEEKLWLNLIQDRVEELKSKE